MAVNSCIGRGAAEQGDDAVDQPHWGPGGMPRALGSRPRNSENPSQGKGFGIRSLELWARGIFRTSAVQRIAGGGRIRAGDAPTSNAFAKLTDWHKRLERRER